ncbi:MAG: hypothetical protein RJA22_2271 [Verrucomicrobiota bacterium]
MTQNHSNARSHQSESMSPTRRHLYVYILMVLMMLTVNSLRGTSGARDYRPTELPPPIKSCEVYPAPVTVTP